jgi:hypothetical protein
MKFAVKFAALRDSIYMAHFRNDESSLEMWCAIKESPWMTLSDMSSISGMCTFSNFVWRHESYKTASQEEIDNIVYSAIISEYDFMNNTLVQEFAETTTSIKKGLVEKLVAFDEESTKKLRLMNRRFLLFYLFRVHELVIMLENKTLLVEIQSTLVVTKCCRRIQSIIFTKFFSERITNVGQFSTRFNQDYFRLF